MLIGEVAQATGVTTKTLRYYEAEGLLPPPARTAGGYRDYPPATIDRVAFIKRAQAAGLTLAQINEVLVIRDAGSAPCAHVATLVDERLDAVDRRLRELQDTRRELLDLRKRLDELDPTDCPPHAICAAMPLP